MRPRVFAAEDGSWSHSPAPGPDRFNEAAGIRRGRRRHVPDRARDDPASMRPRVFAAEDSETAKQELDLRKASMRPRVFAAEDLRLLARCRGDPVASMRPRVFAAEDGPAASSTTARFALQ